MKNDQHNHKKRQGEEDLSKKAIETTDVGEEEKQIEELKAKYLRALADYQNLERQTQAWKEEFVQYSNLGLIKKLLEVLDDLEKAQGHIKDEGLDLVVNKLRNILGEEGLVEIQLEGKEYNPELAEVVSTESGEQNSIITKVLQKGYKLKDKVIRAAKVIVSINAS